MDIRNIDRCRPAGAWVWGGSFFYTDVAPLGLKGVGTAMLHRCRPAGAWVWGGSFFYTDVAPLGLRKGAVASHNYTDAAPLGLNGSGHRDATQMPPRWG